MFTLLFVGFLLLASAVPLWLAQRQMRHVRAHRDHVPAPFAGRIALARHRHAADYTVARVQLDAVQTVVHAAVLLGFTLLGGLQWLDQAWARAVAAELPRQLLLLASVMALLSAVGLPFTLWRKFRLEARFGFNRVTWRLFISDAAKGLMLSLLLGAPLAAAALWLMQSAGAQWAWWVWGLWLAFNVLVLWLFPTVIAPLFNTFTPLDQPEMAARVQALAQRSGFALKGLFVMDGSRRSAHSNAYFTGLGRAKRIVFFDTLLKRLNLDEIEAVLAHELGHFKHRHILKRMVLSFATALVFLHALAWLAGKTWFYTELGVVPQLGRANDALALILFILVVPVFTFWFAPLASLWSRRDEFQADQYAAEQASADALVSALLKLYDDNAATLTPDPLYSAFHDSHPAAVERIERLRHA